MIEFKHLFGPVPSRRLGRSLGVDLVPLKTCTLNCVFCQAGVTTLNTLERKEYVPVDETLAELESWFEAGGSADVVTLSGSGEPTLHSRFGEVLKRAREITGIKTAVLTNGSLLFLPEVREAACEADLVKVSLSCWSQDLYEKLLRPNSELDVNRVIDGIRTFRADFSGNIWIEVFLVPGINDAEEDVRRVAQIIKEIGPEKVHLNTAVRPPAEASVKPVSKARREELAKLFTPRAEVV